MGKHCAALCCKNNSQKLKYKYQKEGVTFHSFPLKRPDILKKWMDALKRKNFSPTQYSFLCSEHFQDEDFDYQPFTGMRMIKKAAVPSKFVFPEGSPEREQTFEEYRQEVLKTLGLEYVGKERLMEDSVPMSSLKTSNSSEDGQYISEVKTEILSDNEYDDHKDLSDLSDENGTEMEQSPHFELTSSVDVEYPTEMPSHSTNEIDNEAALKTEKLTESCHQSEERECDDETFKVESSAPAEKPIYTSKHYTEQNKKAIDLLASMDLQTMDRHSKLKAAYEATLSGLSARAASRMFKVSRTTLRDRISGRVSIDLQRTSLTREEEGKFSKWAIAMANAGFPRTRVQFVTAIQTYLNQLQEPELRFKDNNKPGKTWFHDYLRRHPELVESRAASRSQNGFILTPAESCAASSLPANIPPPPSPPAPTPPSQPIPSSRTTSDSPRISVKISPPTATKPTVKPGPRKKIPTKTETAKEKLKKAMKTERLNNLRAAYEATQSGMSARAASRMFKVSRTTLRDRLSGRVSLDEPKTSLTREEKMDRKTQLKAAYEATQTGMSAYAASMVFKVSESALRDRIRGKVPLDGPGRTSLTKEEEEKFSEWAIAMANAGSPCTRIQFVTAIQRYLNQLQEPELRFKDCNKPRKSWFTHFMTRHPELTQNQVSTQGQKILIITPTEGCTASSSPSDASPPHPPSLYDILPSSSLAASSPSQPIPSSCSTSESPPISRTISPSTTSRPFFRPAILRKVSPTKTDMAKEKIRKVGENAKAVENPSSSLNNGADKDNSGDDWDVSNFRPERVTENFHLQICQGFLSPITPSSINYS